MEERLKELMNFIKRNNVVQGRTRNIMTSTNIKKNENDEKAEQHYINYKIKKENEARNKIQTISRRECLVPLK